MNYKHAYHAGSIADVFKHSVLIQLLKALQKKPQAFCYMETHAGNALYDLLANPSQKTKEYKPGIATLWKAEHNVVTEINDYLHVVRSINSTDKLQFYPGSGLIAKHYLRAQDTAVLCDLHPHAYADLYHYFRKDEHVHVHHRDGYEALAGLLPPKEKRSLVLIDPPYEAIDEYQQLMHAIIKMQTRWPRGVYAIWFPIKQYELILSFYHFLKETTFANILAAECWNKQDADDNKIKGSGLVIINPPWQFDKLLYRLLVNLAHALNITTQGKTKVNWLVKLTVNKRTHHEKTD